MSWTRKTRFMMNVNIRTDLRSSSRLRDRVETSLELICTRPIDLQLGMLGTGGVRLLGEWGQSYDLGNLFNQVGFCC